jgi:hypothetical protein
MVWLHLIKGIRDKMNDPNLPVLMEIERRQPGYWRRHVIGVIVIGLLLAVLMFFWLSGWEIPFVP